MKALIKLLIHKVHVSHATDEGVRSRNVLHSLCFNAQQEIVIQNKCISLYSIEEIITSPSPSAGKYIFEVRSVTDPAVTLRAPEPITVVPPPMRNSEIGRVFQDFEDMLQFDI